MAIYWFAFRLFSGFGRSLNWEVDDPVEFVHICNYLMIYEHFVIDMFPTTFPQNYCRAFPENQFREVLFALKTSSYLFLTRKKTLWVSCHTNMKKFLFFADLLLVPSPANFQQFCQQSFDRVRAELTIMSHHYSFCYCDVFVLIGTMDLDWQHSRPRWQFLWKWRPDC